MLCKEKKRKNTEQKIKETILGTFSEKLIYRSKPFKLKYYFGKNNLFAFLVECNKF